MEYFELLSPVKLSLQISIISLIFVAVIGISLATFIGKGTFRGKVLVETVLMLPLVLPPTVTGFILIIIFGGNSTIGKLFDSFFRTSLMFSWWAAVMTASIVSLPLMYQSVKTGFQAVDKDIEEAARVDGASEWVVFLKISLPLAYKSIITGMILSFARSLGEFGATLMFAGNIPGKTQTAPTAIYVALESGDIKTAWFLVLCMILLSFLMLFLSTSLSRK
ncbi:molybdate ABC transporter permease subunit [Neobacillus sp. D3-1R]|uniref:molybdate ABC transporter permease subunit n=1 Tax=Neobacillus sp. D3-1R TaxID=3445778 RepID=UPI003F9F6EA1